MNVSNVSAESIKLKLGSNDILNGISINAEDKEFIGIIGPNGCGKSTLLKCIYRTLKPDQGAVYISNKDVLTMKYSESGKKLAVVSQQNHYNFDFVVRDVVLMGRSPHKKLMERDNAEDYKIVEESLEAVGMLKHIKRQFSTLSGGEQQRIILARALAQKTDILVLDELTNHLDIRYQLQLLHTVKSLDKTVIAAFHDLNMAGMFCDRIFAIQGGKIVKDGKVEDVLTEEVIHELYKVSSKIERDDTGRIHVKYFL